jgi:hypothetical protein
MVGFFIVRFFGCILGIVGFFFSFKNSFRPALVLRDKLTTNCLVLLILFCMGIPLERYILLIVVFGAASLGGTGLCA